jgi:cation:H+ antiporter
MDFLHNIIQSHTGLAVLVMLAAFFLLAKCASVFVDSSVAIANRLQVPKLVIGIVLVSLATTTPELSVSLVAALRGKAEMALGNAIGSVIVDDGLALPLAGLFATAPILIYPRVLRTSGVFLLVVSVICFVFVAGDLTLSRWEGAVLVALFLGYAAYLVRQHQRGAYLDDVDMDEVEKAAHLPLTRSIVLFIVAIGGIVLCGDLIVASATRIARTLGISEAVIALTLVAAGTSIPEMATCVVAARKGHGALAVGNIIGADILNVCWIAGASALANDLTLSAREVRFMFPWMFVIVGAMLGMLRWRHRLTRGKSLALLILFVVYLVSFAFVFPPQPAASP